LAPGIIAEGAGYVGTSGEGGFFVSRRRGFTCGAEQHGLRDPFVQPPRSQVPDWRLPSPTQATPVCGAGRRKRALYCTTFPRTWPGLVGTGQQSQAGPAVLNGACGGTRVPSSGIRGAGSASARSATVDIGAQVPQVWLGTGNMRPGAFSNPGAGSLARPRPLPTSKTVTEVRVGPAHVAQFIFPDMHRAGPPTRTDGADAAASRYFTSARQRGLRRRSARWLGKPVR